MKKIRFIMNIFTMITTLTFVVVAVFTTVLFKTDFIEPAVLWQVLVASFLCAVSTLIFPWGRAMKIRETIIRTVVHYLMINVIILGGGFLFGWYDIENPGSVLAMVISIFLIYGCVSVVSWTRSFEEAKRMNQKLQEYQKR